MSAICSFQLYKEEFSLKPSQPALVTKLQTCKPTCQNHFCLPESIVLVGVNKSDRHCRLLLLWEIKFHPYLHFSKMNYKWIYPERDKVNSEIHMFLVSNQKVIPE